MDFKVGNHYPVLLIFLKIFKNYFFIFCFNTFLYFSKIYLTKYNWDIFHYVFLKYIFGEVYYKEKQNDVAHSCSSQGDYLIRTPHFHLDFMEKTEFLVSLEKSKYTQ